MKFHWKNLIIFFIWCHQIYFSVYEFMSEHLDLYICSCLRAFTYHKVASSSLSLLVAHFLIFWRLMKGKFDDYVLWPLAKKFQNWIVDRSTARNFPVCSFMGVGIAITRVSKTSLLSFCYSMILFAICQNLITKIIAKSALWFW